MVITGPAIIKSVTGEDLGLEELGGAKVHSEKTGQAHFVAQSDPECIDIIKKLKTYTEERKTQIRNIRREYRDMVKKMKDDKDISEDEEKRFFK